MSKRSKAPPFATTVVTYEVEHPVLPDNVQEAINIGLKIVARSFRYMDDALARYEVLMGSSEPHLVGNRNLIKVYRVERTLLREGETEYRET